MTNDSLKTKWIALKSLVTAMLSDNPIGRPTCAQILTENLWSIAEKDISYYGLDENIMKNHPDHFFA